MQDQAAGPPEDQRPLGGDAAPGSGPSNRQPLLPNVFPVAVLVEGGMGMAALGLGWLLNSVPTLRWDPQEALWGLLATVPLAGLLLVCVHTPLRVFQDLVRLIDRWVVPLFARWNLTQIAIVSLLAGLGEEMLFRGVIQNALQARIHPPFGTWVGWLLSSFLFGAAHAVSATYAVLATLIGLYLGRLWIETGNLLVPVVAHAAYDFLALVYLVRVRKRA